MTARRKITDKNGVQVFPITHTKAVLDDNGNSVEQRLQENLDLINAKQFEEGDVEWDTEPNEDNNDHVVTSSGIHRVLTDDEFVTAKALVNLWLNLHRLDALENAMPNKMGEEEAEVIARALTEINAKGDAGASNKVSGSVTVSNAEYIDILSASFADGSKPDKGKDWTTMVSSQTDYNYKDFAVSGSNPVGWMNNYIRTKQVDGKFALVVGIATNGVPSTKIERTAEIVSDSLLSIGVKPILCDYHDSTPSQCSTLRNFAERNGYYYMSPAEYYGLVYKGDSGIGNDGFHLATRDIGIWASATLPQLQRIERPMQSLKIFRLRSGSAEKTLDELVFHSNEERFENFTELYFGQLKGGDEYGTLRNNGAVTFAYGMLVAAILPVEVKDLTNVRLKFNTTDTVSVYVLDTIAAPYPVVNYYTRFSIDYDVAMPTVGDKYSESGQEYTVVGVVVGENNMAFTIYCSPGIQGTGGSGTLTKVSGSGASTYNYSLREYAALSAESAVDNDNNGHWVELTNDNGYGFTNMSGRVQFDKVHFLVLSANSFSISNPRVEYEGLKIKKQPTGEKVMFDSNEYNGSTELIQESVFGSVGSTLQHWTDDSGNGVTTVASYDNKYPFSASVVEVDDEHCMKQTVACGVGKYWLEIYAKYLHDDITEDSYDFNELAITINSKMVNTINTRYDSVTRHKVQLSWTIIRVPVNVPVAQDIVVKLSSNSQGVQVNKVSLKKY